MTRRPTVAEALAELRAAFAEGFLPLARWVDRQLRRSPRLYRWLS